MALHLRKLVVENIKRVKVVAIEPRESFVQITGANGSGKSTVLDAIAYALTGKRSLPGYPVRDGELVGRVTLDMGELVVRWRVTSEGVTSLAVENAAGVAARSPQAILDSIRGELAFDPLAFSRMKPREQFESLRRVANLSYDFEAQDVENRDDYNTRTIVNRYVKQHEAEAAAIVLPPNPPTEPVDTLALAEELRSIDAHNRQVKDSLRLRMELNERILEVENQIFQLHKRRNELIRQRESPPEVAEPRDPGPVEKRLVGAKARNDVFDLVKKRQEILKKLEAARVESHKITERMDRRKREREAAITSANLPIPGLGFGDGFVTFDGQPLAQASSSEQLRVGLAVAMAANPKLRLLLVRDGNLLDEQSMEIVKKMTAADDYTVLMERVDTTGTVGVYLEDGEVRRDNYTGEAPPRIPSEQKPIEKASDGVSGVDPRDIPF